MKEAIKCNNAPQAIGPYSQAIKINDALYISGQLPINPSTGEMSPDIKEQAKQCLENIKAILKEAGLEMNSVVRCGIFVKDLNDFIAVNEVYATYFSEPYPARATVEVSRLPKDAQIEIEATAIFS